MKQKKNFSWKIASLILLGFFFTALPVSAHEAYVLSHAEFQAGLKQTGFDALLALRSPDNLRVFITGGVAVILLLLLNFYYRRSPLGRKVNHKIEKLNKFGPMIVRLAISASFFFSALSWSFFGPELPLQQMPLASLVRVLLFVLSALLLIGLGTEVAALAALALFAVAGHVYGWYLLTYFNYLGEIIALLFFGSRFLSMDQKILGVLKRFPNFRQYQTVIVRICYGFALAYAAVNVKFLHPLLTLTVVKRYDLTRFHLLFPHDPLLVTLGAALAELMIGIFIIIGFETRLTVFISLIYITLSLLYFRELVWPHFLLYGISLNLILDPEKFTIDNWLKLEAP